MTRKLILSFMTFMVFVVFAPAQMTPWFQWTLLSQEAMEEIIGETSGEATWNSVVAMGGYNRNRAFEEYEGTFYEVQYLHKKLKDHGIPGTEIVRLPAANLWKYGEGELWEKRTWDGIKGELWEIEPARRKLASYRDLTAMLLKGSRSSDVTAELVWIGLGSEEELLHKDIAGKIAVTEGHPVEVHKRACMDRGAAGVISMHSKRPYVDPLQIHFPWSSLRPAKGRPVKFAFCLSPREGQYLKKRLLSGEKIVVHAQVESKLVDFDIQNVVCHIPGTDPEAGEIIFCAHLFEWYTKQGANDNKSGCAALLEIARVLHTLIEEGRLPRPKRTIRFIWGPEFAGTGMWARENRELLKNALCVINMDMVGAWLSKSKSFFCLFRTSFGNPHYINDVVENYYRFVGEGNRDRLHNLYRNLPYEYAHRIVAPSGSDEPFYYRIETHFKGSDGEVFNDWGVQIPAVFMLTFPDQWLHSSGDRPDKVDPTTLKRAVVIGISSAYTIASANDDMAIKIAGEVASNGTRRLGHQLIRGLEALNRCTASNLTEAYRTAKIFIETTVSNEKATHETILELAENKTRLRTYISTLNEMLTEISNAHCSVLEVHMLETARLLGVKAVTIQKTTFEEQSSQKIPYPTALVKAKGFLGYLEFLHNVPEAVRSRYPSHKIASIDELHLLINGKNSILDIKNKLDTQFPTKSDLQHIVNYLEILKTAGLVEIKR